MKIKYHWKILFTCCCLSGAVAGMVVHCRGIFYAPAAASLGVSPTTYATYLTCGGLAGVVCMPVVTKLFRSLPIKRILLVYLTIFCGSVIALGCAQAMWQCYLIGACQGTVSSFLTLYPVSTIVKNWFTKKRGLFTGLASMLAGLMASVMNILLERLIASAGWRTAYITVGVGAFLLSAIPVSLFLVREPADIGLVPYGGEAPKTSARPDLQKGGISRQLLPTFLPMAVIVAICYMSGGYGQHLSNYAVEIGLTPSAGALMVSCCMLGNVCGKLLGGLLNDLIGVYRASGVTILSISLAFFILLSRPDNTALLYLAALLCGQTTAFLAVQVPLLLGSVYHTSAEYDACFSAVMMIGSLTSAVNSTLIGILHTKSGSYALGHGLNAVLLLLCAGMIAVLWAVSRRRSVSYSQNTYGISRK